MLTLTDHARVSIGPAREARRHEDFTAEDFAGDPGWLEIEGPRDLGRLGDVGDGISKTISARPFDRAIYYKCGRRPTTWEPSFDLTPWLPGQAALLAASEGADDFAFRLVLNDAPPGGTPSSRFFLATVNSAIEVFGGPGDQPRLAVSCILNSRVVRVHPEQAP